MAPTQEENKSKTQLKKFPALYYIRFLLHFQYEKFSIHSNYITVFSTVGYGRLRTVIPHYSFN